MSDVSILSGQYETLVETSDRVNNSIIVLKKQHLLANDSEQKYSVLQVDDTVIEEASKFVVHFLNNLSGLLNGSSARSDDIPSVVVEDYVQKLHSKIPSVEDELGEIVKAVEKKSALEDEQLQIMDKILMTLDSERKVLFRKLRSS